MNKAKLRGKVAERGMTLTKLSKAIGINNATLYRKMNADNDGGGFTVEEVRAIASVLALTGDDINSIFFNQEIA